MSFSPDHIYLFDQLNDCHTFQCEILIHRLLQYYNGILLPIKKTLQNLPTGVCVGGVRLPQG